MPFSSSLRREGAQKHSRTRVPSDTQHKDHVAYRRYPRVESAQGVCRNGRRWDDGCAFRPSAVKNIKVDKWEEREIVLTVCSVYRVAQDAHRG